MRPAHNRRRLVLSSPLEECIINSGFAKEERPIPYGQREREPKKPRRNPNRRNSACRMGPLLGQRSRPYRATVGTPLCRGRAAVFEELLPGLPRHAKTRSKARLECLYVPSRDCEAFSPLGPSARTARSRGDAAGEGSTASQAARTP